MPQSAKPLNDTDFRIEAVKRRSLLGQGLWLVRHRPRHLLRVLRGFSFFCLARLGRRLWGFGEGVTLGPNVRLQRNSSIMAEAPHARITIGANSIIYEDARLEAYGNGAIEIGDTSVLGDLRIISRYQVRIGARLLSSWNVFIQDFDPHPIDPIVRRQQVEYIAASFRPRFDGGVSAASTDFAWNFPGEAVVIGDDVWLGANATILKGAHIGSGSIVAAGAVVLGGEYPEKSLLAGNPAVIVKRLQP